MGKPATAEEQDALFQAIIRKIPQVADPAQLQEAACLALALMLRRPADRQLRDELSHQIHRIVAEVKPGHSADATRNELRFAARGCIKVLQAAKERRLPRAQQVEADNWAQSDGTKTFKPVHHHSEDEDKDKKTTRLVLAGTVLVILAGVYAWWSGQGVGESSAGSDGAKFAQQVMEAAQGGGPPQHMFGGALKQMFMGERPVVVAEGVPPGACAAAGWALVRSGILSINGVTPSRVSAGKITELCNSEDGNATIMWAPK